MIEYADSKGGNDVMTKKYKIIAIIFMLVLCVIIIGKKEDNVYTQISASNGNTQISYISKQNIYSSDNGIKYIGHRGIGGRAPENTIPAFKLAGKLGFWGAECDVRTTSDGNWMILHDDTVNRMTNGTGKIKNLSTSNVQALNIVSGKNISNFKKLKIPKLQDYLSVCKSSGLIAVIEMKPSDNLLYYNSFIEIVKKDGNLEKTIVISSSRKSLNELRKRDSNLTLGLICSNITNANIYYVKSLGNAFMDSSYHNITKSQVNLCHENNIKVGAWTVDDTALARNLSQMGVDYLTTNELLPAQKKNEISIN